MTSAICSIAGAAPPASEVAGSQCPKGLGSALAEVACEIARGLGPLPEATLVVASQPVSDRPLADGRGLSALLARVVAGKLGPNARAASEAADLVRARSLARKSRVLVHVEPTIQNGELRVTVDAHAAHESFWDRIRFSDTRAIQHAFASRRIDAEIAAFLRPVPLVATAVDKAVAPGRAVALACGDANEDGSLELLVAGRQRLWLGRLRRGRFVVEREAAWSALSPVAPYPLRQPVAAASIRSGGFIDVGVSDRAAAVRLDADLHAVNRLSGAVPWDGIGCLAVSGTGLGSLRPCASNEPRSAVATPEQPVDAVASARLTTARGEARHVFAWRSPDGVVTAGDDSRRTVRLSDAGAQIALGDLDRDGLAEIITTKNTLDPAEDAIVVSTWTAEGAIEERFRIAAPNGVLALSVCPPEAPGLAFVAVATGDQIWILR